MAAYAAALMEHVISDPRLSFQAPVVLYRTLGLPVESAEGAVLLGICFKLAMEHHASVARAGFEGAPLEIALRVFSAILEKPSGVVFALDEWSGVLDRIATPDRKLHLALPDLLETFSALLAAPREARDPRFPLVLSAGERRAFTANTIIRDPAWRKKDREGCLRLSPADAEELGVASGETVRLVTKRDALLVVAEVSPSMQRGHVSLPNGLGVSDGSTAATGAAPNELTASEDRDPFVGTPWHKSVPARIERVSAS